MDDCHCFNLKIQYITGYSNISLPHLDPPLQNLGVVTSMIRNIDRMGNHIMDLILGN